jgi:hypothetical protein
MKTIITKTDIYKFDELSEDAQNNALKWIYGINVKYEWWESTYDDAANIGLKITSFDLYRNRHCKGEFLASAEETAHKIEADHGDTTETYKTAIAYLSERDAIIEKAEKDENGEYIDEYALDNELDAADNDFLCSILEDYASILQKDYNYLTSRESIIETIKANDYDFTIEGKLF